MEGYRTAAGRIRKPDGQAVKRAGKFVKLEADLFDRIDAVRQATPRAAWIRRAIERSLYQEEVAARAVGERG